MQDFHYFDNAATTMISDRALEEQIETLVHKTWKKYYAVVDIDRSYV